MPQTRSAAKRAAGAALLSDDSTEPGNKRPANINQTQEKTYRTKHAQKQSRYSVSPAQPNTIVLPHGLGAVQQSATLNDDDRKLSSSFNTTAAGIKKMTLEELKKAARPRGLPKETPDNKYRLMPGSTPFPDWSRPTPEECQAVYDILVEEYEEKQKAREETATQPKKYAPLSFTPPAKIQPPSTTVAGCGEVPDLVDAMMRTLISQSVTRDSANMVVERIIARFGQLDPQGIGAASINWNAVRLAPPEYVIQTLHKGGLQNKKYEGIKGCLDMVYTENQVRRSAYMNEKETGKVANVPGAAEMTAGQKEHQLKKIEAGILTLDHIRAMPADDAMMALIKYPHIGVKTAACLLLFCLQIPSFAVDTHVYRMCKWLYWVPGTENENYVYMHCDLRVPGHLKYGLHQLFIEHGSGCHRCKGNTSKGTTEWDKVVCPLEHLLDRYSKKESKSKAANVVGIENNGSNAHETREGLVQSD
ncbi:HhH-GPD superfamily base excision DNA repair protein [Colletotrichum navitas]|uniref:HhH-GPD superfamily base excision DNA repair protein n=1 Tax=Colletotrichum navitas TaxID=681940 RepID=A0AAD8Q094_9PEZI|nr:HhH-GPD superfamily base excision DNA repair protein [Colletotrichum navitas]KAK1590873.1 HhH-GPD superfamily base excision DNA repair protein [Colletotrichum navitas]